MPTGAYRNCAEAHLIWGGVICSINGSLLRWLPEEKSDEFIYDLEKSPKGHLPLTSTLRGTQLLERLMDHEAWKLEEFADITF